MKDLFEHEDLRVTHSLSSFLPLLNSKQKGVFRNSHET
ncbi:hypothetical protein BVRB_3g057950 [Beta vulgaris subsp. vulgaris]|nr:hypothetical protein BVRB_3g057950 [Beta vulgaris subsp. vulgaris]